MKLLKNLFSLAVTLIALCVTVLGVLVMLDECKRRRYVQVAPGEDA